LLSLGLRVRKGPAFELPPLTISLSKSKSPRPDDQGIMQKLHIINAKFALSGLSLFSIFSLF
jgi:hypothetical protein